jgi:type II secretory pathway pseudopilin PulG
MVVSSRSGFSLLEVILATGILLGAAIVLAELAAVGRQHARSADEFSTAQRVCQVKMNEMLIGAAPLRAVEKEPLENEPGWLCTIEIEPVDRPGLRQGLAELRVTVAQDVPEDRPGKQYTLTRWIRDPDWEGPLPTGAAPAEGPAAMLPPPARGGPQP